MHLHKIENQYNILWEYNFELENIKKLERVSWDEAQLFLPFFRLKWGPHQNSGRVAEAKKYSKTLKKTSQV